MSQITDLLQTAEASAVMIVENSDYNYKCGFSDLPDYIPAIKAIYAAEQRHTPLTALNAEKAALVFLEAHPEMAIKAINLRLAARAAKASAPLSQGALRALQGQD